MIGTAIGKGDNERAIVWPPTTTSDKVEDHILTGTVAGDGGAILTSSRIHAEIKNDTSACEGFTECDVRRKAGGVKALVRILI